jgi:hypothetical protein
MSAPQIEFETYLSENTGPINENQPGTGIYSKNACRYLCETGEQLPEIPDPFPPGFMPNSGGLPIRPGTPEYDILVESLRRHRRKEMCEDYIRAWENYFLNHKKRAYRQLRDSVPVGPILPNLEFDEDVYQKCFRNLWDNEYAPGGIVTGDVGRTVRFRLLTFPCVFLETLNRCVKAKCLEDCPNFNFESCSGNC